MELSSPEELVKQVTELRLDFSQFATTFYLRDKVQNYESFKESLHFIVTVVKEEPGKRKCSLFLLLATNYKLFNVHLIAKLQG